MLSSLPRSASACLCLLSLNFWAWAAPAGPEVEVGSVRFSGVRTPQGGGALWQEMDVNLAVKPASLTAGGMVSRVKVSVLLTYEVPALAGAARQLQHYRAEAECVALEPGHANVRFYLPPEIVRRDQLRGDPKFWGVELAVAGRPLPAGRLAYAPALSSAEQRRKFQSEAVAAAGANDGILQPQFLTPFMLEYARSTPAFVRR